MEQVRGSVWGILTRDAAGNRVVYDARNMRSVGLELPDARSRDAQRVDALMGRAVFATGLAIVTKGGLPTHLALDGFGKAINSLGQIQSADLDTVRRGNTFQNQDPLPVTLAPRGEPTGVRGSLTGLLVMDEQENLYILDAPDGLTITVAQNREISKANVGKTVELRGLLSTDPASGNWVGIAIDRFRVLPGLQGLDKGFQLATPFYRSLG